MKVFCIIPAFEASRCIGKVLRGVGSVVDQIIVVDDGSSDDTSAEAEKCGVITLRHVVNRGQGAALRTGTEYALAHGADIIVHFDADGQFSADDIKDMVAPLLSDEADVVLGSRFMGKDPRNMPWFKRFVIMPLARAINRVFLGIETTDPQSGFRAMTARVASSIDIENDRMAHCSEILHKVFAGGWRVREVPITVEYFEFGQRIGGGWKILKDLFLSKLIN